MPPLSLHLLVILSLLSPSLSSPITLPLHHLPLPPLPSPLSHLASLASSSILRATLLKSPIHTPLSPHSYGGYSIPITLGTPPQPLPLLFDTGSSLPWIPCTPSYRCTRCSSPSNPTLHIPFFFPKRSSSSRLVGSRNPKCTWIHPQILIPRSNASQICPPYLILYGSGSTAGILILDTLALPGRSISNFAVGCSIYSDRQPAGGLAGFGRGPASFPSQLAVSRFAYCLISRQFDDQPHETGTLVLDAAPESTSSGFSFIPFGHNPNNSDPAFSVYYYIELRRIMVGGKKVKIPYGALVPGPAGGAIIDSGTTFTYMTTSVFEPVVQAFVDSVAGKYNRSTETETMTGLRPCFLIPEGVKEMNLPQLVLHFKGGAEMRLPVENFFAFVGRAACLTVVSGEGASGPAVILGSFQQQNYYMLYDLEKGRLGFRRQSCLGT